MGKTFRYDADTGASGRSRKKRKATRANCAPAAAPQPVVITEEWAVRRMADHLRYELERLIAEGVITIEDKEDYTSMINRFIRNAVPTYDAEVTEKTGKRRASAAHYFTIVVDRAILNIRKYVERMCRKAVEVPISSLPPNEAERYGYVSAESLSDEARSVRELDFRLDVNTLRGMMTPDEVEAFDLLLTEESHVRIADRLGISESWFRRGLLKRIQQKARKCGFLPKAEREA